VRHLDADRAPLERAGGFFLYRLGFAALLACACCASPAWADDDFRAGLTLRAGFGGIGAQSWAPHLLASFGSSPQILQQNRSAEAQCLMTAGDLRIGGAVNASSACTSAPLLQFDLNDDGLHSANLFGLNLMKAPSVFEGNHRDVLSGNSDWVNWTLRQHALASGGDNATTPSTGTK
jgi:hypothetical protein